MNKINLAGCVILKKNSILLLHRTKNDWYELPGGKVDEGETPEQAAIRELKEEILSDASIIRQIYIKDFQEDGQVFTYTCFLAEIRKEQTPQLGEPHKFDRLAYIPLSKLSLISLSPNMKNLMEELKLKNISLEN